MYQATVRFPGLLMFDAGLGLLPLVACKRLLVFQVMHIAFEVTHIFVRRRARERFEFRFRIRGTTDRKDRNRHDAHDSFHRLLLRGVQCHLE